MLLHASEVILAANCALGPGGTFAALLAPSLSLEAVSVSYTYAYVYTYAYAYVNAYVYV